MAPPPASPLAVSAALAEPAPEPVPVAEPVRLRPRLTPVPTSPRDPLDQLTAALAASFPGQRPLLVSVEHGAHQSALCVSLTARDGEAALAEVHDVARASGAAVASAAAHLGELRVVLLVVRRDASVSKQLPPDELPAATWRDHVRAFAGLLRPAKR